MDKEIYAEYEAILLKKKHNYSSALFGVNEKSNFNNACEIMRYAFELLGWTPKDVYNGVTTEIIHIMKLDVLLKYVNFPEELSQKEDLNYLAHILYPNIIKIDINDIVINVYKKVLEKKRYGFPKRYLQGENGVQRLCVCFTYMIKQYFNFHSIKEFYEYFSTAAGNKSLSSFSLYVACNTLFDTPVDLAHTALDDSQKNLFYYQYYKFQYLLRNVK